ncbi:AAA family ATPase [Lentzea sp. NEAU-D13]|uniref:AAA family ATPase n=1 Tax=Lentzea alba TaxID=2714351 RepID=A0A7C9W0J6_9PSEU|nr:LuxR family transcriptional regulator [Lentzea alba]NGY63301.1 AAA family ATPase [Lentzea alba]
MTLERDVELGHLAAVFDQARTGAGATVVISGPLGVGRSALLLAGAAWARRAGYQVRWAAASPLESDFVLGVVLQLLALGQHGEPAVSESTVDSIVHALSTGEPLALLVDDLQWSDEASLRALARLACRIGRLPVVLVVTVRDGDPGTETPLVREVLDAAAVVLRPRDLSPAATGELVASAFGEPGDEKFVRRCHEITAGSPIALTALLADLAADGIRPAVSSVEDLSARRPESLRARLVSCVRALPASTRAVVHAVAALGDDADEETARLLARLDPIRWSDTVRRLTRLGLFAAGLRPRFAHVFAADAVEHAMPAREREVLHLRAAELGHHRGRPAEQVAAHLLAVTMPLDEWAISALREAGRLALDRGEPVLAARCLRRAVFAVPEDGPRRARLLVDLAVAIRDTDPAVATRHIVAALPHLGSARERGAALMRLEPSWLARAPQPVADLIRGVTAELGDVATLTGVDRDLALRLEARTRYLGCGDPNVLAASARRLAELGSEPAITGGAERELLIVLLHSSMLSVRISAPDAARTAKRILDREPAARGHVHTPARLLIKVLVTAGALDEALSWLDTAADLASPLDGGLELALIDADRALVRAHQGATADAVALAVAAARAPVPDWAVPESPFVRSMVLTAIECEDPDLTRLVLERCEAHVPVDRPVPAAVRLLRASLADGEDDVGALSYVLECGSEFERLGWRNPALVPWRAWAARLHRRLGDLPEARRLADEQRRLAATWGEPRTHGRALRLLGEMTEGARGVALLQDAVDVLESAVRPQEVAATVWSLANRLRAAELPGHERAAARAHRLALSDPDSLAAGPLPSGADSASGIPALTEGESRVAELVAEGLTNGEIAELLEVSRRAVEKRLTNCYRKLGVAGRTGLLDVLGFAQGSGTAPLTE